MKNYMLKYFWYVESNKCIIKINFLPLLPFYNPHPRICLLILDRQEGSGEREREEGRGRKTLL